MSFRRNARTAPPWRRRAVTLIWVALGGLIFIGFVGLAMDTGHVLYAGQQLQIVADAASLAAARLVRTDEAGARTSAVNTAAQNYVYGNGVQLEPNNGNTAGGDVVVGTFNRFTYVFTPTQTLPNAVQVTARRTAGSLSGALPLIFAPGWGVNNANVTRDAIAMIGGAGAGLIVLDPSKQCSLDVGGSSTLSVTPAPPNTCDIYGAGIQVNSTNNRAACTSGNPVITTTGIDITGPTNSGGWASNNNATLTNPCPSSPTGSDLVHTQQPPIPDPLAAIPEPSTTGLIDRGRIEVGNSDNVTLDPGYYSQGIKASGGTLTLKPGVYILGGDTGGGGGNTGLNVAGGATFCAKGVMLFIKGPSGVVDITGSANCPGGTGGIDISPIDLSKSSSYFCNSTFLYPGGINSLYQGIAIFQSRSNNGVSSGAKISGSGCLNITGTLYFPSNDLTLSGGGTSFGNQVIANTVTLKGGSNITIPYDGRNTALGGTVYLVE